MNVLVDTSVWVDFFNDHDSAEARMLALLIEREEEILTSGVILAEFFQGLRQAKSITKLETYFLDMPLLSPREPETYLDAAKLFRDLRARGITIRSTIDCLIVKLAEENSAMLLAKDRDIHLILSSGLTQVNPPPDDR